MNGNGKRGSVLLFVLLVVFASAAILASVAEYASVALRSRAAAANEFELRHDAYSALNAAVAVLEEYSEIDGGLFSARQGWGRPFADGRIQMPDGAEAEVAISDESGKIPLRAVKSDRLAKIIESFGVSERDSQKYADLITDWVDADDSPSVSGAEYSDYDRGAALPPNRPMESFAELALVRDLDFAFFDADSKPTPLFEKFAAVFSLERFSKTNLNAASDAVLEALMFAEQKDFSPSLPSAIRGDIGYVKDGIFWCKSAEDLLGRGAGEYPTTATEFKVQYFVITIDVSRGLARYKLVAHYAAPSAFTSSDSGAGSKKSASGSAFENGAINAAASKAAKKGTFKIVKIMEFAK